MATELRLTRTLRGFEPTDDESREAIKAIKMGAEMKCEVRVSRDGARLRYFFGLCKIVLDNTGEFENVDAVKESIKLGIGWVNQVQVYDEEKGWRIERTPKSISFAKMDEIEFREFVKQAEHYVCMALGVTSEQLADALTDYIAPGFNREGKVRGRAA
jgi:predicted transposase YbfD/YdcC